MTDAEMATCARYASGLGSARCVAYSIHAIASYLTLVLGRPVTVKEAQEFIAFNNREADHD